MENNTKLEFLFGGFNSFLALNPKVDGGLYFIFNGDSIQDSSNIIIALAYGTGRESYKILYNDSIRQSSMTISGTTLRIYNQSGGLREIDLSNPINSVLSLRSINTTNGIKGGGNLSSNLNIELDYLSPGGNNGVNPKPARSDHKHDDRYIFDGQTINSLKVTSIPTSATDVANKSYVDALLSGSKVLRAVNIAVTESVDLDNPNDYLDGVALTSGLRVLLLGQPASRFNGVYEVVENNGLKLVRASDADSGEEIALASVAVSGGSKKGYKYMCITPVVEIDTTELEFILIEVISEYVGSEYIEIKNYEITHKNIARENIDDVLQIKNDYERIKYVSEIFTNDTGHITQVVKKETQFNILKWRQF